MSPPLTIGVDATFVARDNRGMGRYIRNILRDWEHSQHHRYVLLCSAKRHLSGLERYQEKGFQVCVWDRAPALDVCWFPWNRVDWNTDCPRVVHIHDISPFTEFHPETRHLEEDRQRLLQAVERAETVVTGSNFTRTEIHRHLDVDWQRMHVIQLAPDSVFNPKPCPGAAAEVLSKVGSEPFLLFVGNLEPRKNLGGLLEAFHLLSRKPNLVLVSPRPSTRWTERLRGRAAPLVELSRELDEHLIWLEGVDDISLAHLYRNCRLFIMPSLYEGFGLPILEAMACGAPVAAARAASLPEVGGDLPYWFNPSDPVDIARVVMEAIDPEEGPDPAPYLEYAARFTWPDTAADITRILTEAAGSRPRS